MSTKTRFKFTCLALMALFLVPIILSACQPAKQPEPGLIGTWTLNGDFLGSGEQQSLTVQINHLTPQPENSNILEGTGCMQSGVSGGWAPLALQAALNAQSVTYTFNIYSTLLAEQLENGMGVIRLTGETRAPEAGKPVSLNGNARTVLGEGKWTGERTAALAVECPAWDASLAMRAEVNLMRDLAFTPPFDGTLFSVETSIVSSELRVLEPDGKVTNVPYHSSIFSLGVDFVNSFLFQGGHIGTPALDKSYIFTLLDALGEPIPGIQDQESFLRCGQGAPVNLQAAFVPGGYLELTWDAPDLVPGEFEPEKGYGLYQIIIEKFPRLETGSMYGAETFQTNHRIPWAAFEPGSTGKPDGTDYGIGLSQFDDGQYIIRMAAYNFYDAPEGEIGFDCRVEDSRHVLFFTKQGDALSIQPGGAISGFVLDKNGKPLSGIAVEFAGINSAMRDRVCSAENGYFLFNNLPLDSFTLSAGQFGTEGCGTNAYLTVELPIISLTAASPIQEDQNITLSAQ